MLYLATAIALGIVMAVLVLAVLPTIVEALGEVLAEVLGVLAFFAFAWLLILAVAWVLGIGYSALGAAGPWVALLVTWLVTWGAWGLTARQALLQLVGIVRHRPGEVSGGWILGSFFGSFVTLVPLGVMEQGADPILQTADLPFTLRLVMVSPVLISFAILVASAAVEGAKRGADFLTKRGPLG